MKTRLAAAFIALAASTAGVSAAELKLVTGPQGGSWYPLGGALKGLIEKVLPGTTVAVAPGGGVANAAAISRGKAQIGFGNSVTTVDALNGTGPFKGKLPGICNIGTLYPQYFQIVALANAGVTSGKDLKGKALTTQKRGNTGEAVTNDWLKAYGFTYKDMGKVNQGSYNDSVNQLKDGNAQVFTLTTQVPAGAIMDIASARDIIIVGIDDDGIKRLQAINSGYKKIFIKAGSYPKQTKDVQTVGFSTHVIVPCNLDAKAAYGITKAIVEGVANLAAIAKAMKGLTAKQIAVDVGVPMHPGATKYFKEKGAL
ncbi:MAG: TAXI family TRAP transporter solute-binding subunit [Hyphomicrobiaceae bacterium]|nr:TAXI family TRAP transporter solute-binding subunit [Hyphomicrobiaceae bacterium]